MKNINIDLWPEINADGDNDVPLTILNKQSEMLSRKTNGLILGDVITHSNKGYIIHTLYLVAPKLDNYRYSLLSIAHGVLPYPVFIYDHSLENKDVIKHKKIINPLSSLSKSIFLPDYILSNDSVPEPNARASSPDEFIKELEKIFKSETTKGILQSLISQSKQIQSA